MVSRRRLEPRHPAEGPGSPRRLAADPEEADPAQRPVFGGVGRQFVCREAERERVVGRKLDFGPLQLHLVIADILAGVEAMEGKVKGEPRREGAEKIARALQAYGEHFDHAGWKPL